ncbi:MAG TPA: hypothetical protein VF701_06795 [Thermoanaerobaculia bacterium]
MKSRIPIILTIAVLAISTSAFGQGYIPQCRTARATLVNYGLLSAVGTLVTQACPQIHNGVWLNGPGNIDPKTGAYGPGCDSAWSAVSANKIAYQAGMDFVTRNCPPIYSGLKWRPGPVAGAGFQGCDLAVQSLAAAGVTVQAGNAVNMNCIQLYQNGWLAQAGGATQATCPKIWNILTNANMLAPMETLVTHNCPWLYSSGNAAVNAPIVP